MLSVRNLSISFPTAAGLVPAVAGISFDIRAGEVVALVGESGSGKTLTALATVALLPEHSSVSGDIEFESRRVLEMTETDLCHLRGGGIGFVFQEPGAALDPVRKIGPEIVSVVKRHRGLTGRSARDEALRLLRMVALPDPEARFHDYPHQMSGGMRQRAMAALALAGSPRLLIADEPTTALDTTIQAQILDLLKSLTRELDLAVLLITHDLGVVCEIATRALVMYAGRIVEDAPVAGLLASPAHPYSKALLECLPLLASGAPRTSRLPVLPGSVPAPGEWPPGCAFAPRCKLAIDQCRSKTPAPDQFSLPSRRAACFRSSEITA